MLSSSIALHLIFDIGNVYEKTAVFNIRRHTIRRLTFRTTAKKVISRDVNYFFRGYKAEGLSFVEKQISPADCKIDFAVPSDLILAKHSAV